MLMLSVSGKKKERFCLRCSYFMKIFSRFPLLSVDTRSDDF